MYRKNLIHQLYSPAARLGEYQTVIKAFVSMTMESAKTSVGEIGALLTKTIVELKEMGQEQAVKNVIAQYLCSLSPAPLSMFGAQLYECYLKNDKEVQALEQCCKEVEVFASRHGLTKSGFKVKQYATSHGQEDSKGNGAQKKKKTKKVKHAAIIATTGECGYDKMCY